MLRTQGGGAGRRGEQNAAMTWPTVSGPPSPSWVHSTCPHWARAMPGTPMQTEMACGNAVGHQPSPMPKTPGWEGGCREKGGQELWIIQAWPGQCHAIFLLLPVLSPLPQVPSTLLCHTVFPCTAWGRMGAADMTPTWPSCTLGTQVQAGAMLAVPSVPTRYSPKRCVRTQCGSMLVVPMPLPGSGLAQPG